MNITGIDYIKGSPYITRKDIAEYLHMSIPTVDRRIKEILEEVANGRYGEFAYINDGGFVLVNYLVFIDYMKYRQQLLNKNLRKNVPPYNPRQIAEEIGWYGAVKDIPAKDKIQIVPKVPDIRSPEVLVKADDGALMLDVGKILKNIGDALKSAAV